MGRDRGEARCGWERRETEAIVPSTAWRGRCAEVAGGGQWRGGGKGALSEPGRAAVAAAPLDLGLVDLGQVCEEVELGPFEQREGGGAVMVLEDGLVVVEQRERMACVDQVAVHHTWMVRIVEHRADEQGDDRLETVPGGQKVYPTGGTASRRLVGARSTRGERGSGGAR